MKDDDKLKKFIQHNLDEFDTEMPSNMLWDKIKKEGKEEEQPLKKNKVFKLNTGWYKIAAAILLVSNVYFVVRLSNQKENETVVIEEVQEDENLQSKVSPLFVEFSNVELVYQSKVDNRLQKLKNYRTEFPEVNQEIQMELSVLGKDFEELKNELDENVMDEVIIQAMVENYQIRLQLLEDILLQIDSYKHKNIEHEINI